ncbi:MAG: carcinine hydrolase/isopenicillin-N N-acyltransferase family protein [Bacteroidota bacterium]|nr:carcinine hydrolase/isopenicillin-N N-acyltransferase family protein [Bacteroidota bacterium]
MLLLTTSTSEACTTAIISGKATIDGRPLLFKQRDTDELNNKLVSFNDGKYSYIGLVNSKDLGNKAVWGGYNSAGFAIMNSASYNLNNSDSVKNADNEGFIMKLALQTCATLTDFEKLLESLPKPLGINANFGVIDAQGGAAYYETGNFRFTKIDVNNPVIAPFGYIIRTNYSFSGERVTDKGLIRYNTAQELFDRASMTNSISYSFILKDVSRCLKHSLTKMNLYDNIPSTTQEPVFVNFRDFIPRYSTSAAIIVQGIKGNESPQLTTMWTILGSPLCSVVIPVWITKNHDLPAILAADTNGNAKLCTITLILKKQLFPIEKENGYDYLNLAALLSKDRNGIYQKIVPIEDQIVSESEKYITRWRKDGINEKEALQFYHWVDQFVLESYKNNFGL